MPNNSVRIIPCSDQSGQPDFPAPVFFLQRPIGRAGIYFYRIGKLPGSEVCGEHGRAKQAGFFLLQMMNRKRNALGDAVLQTT